MSNQPDLIQWILDTLQHNGWSIRELARRANVSSVAITNVLNSNRNAGPELCRGLAKATHTPPETIFALAGILPTRPSTTDQDRKESELLAYYRALDRASQRALITLARALHEQRAEYSADKKNPDE